jgi:hypothetical protein
MGVKPKHGKRDYVVLVRDRLNVYFYEKGAASIGPEYGAIGPIRFFFFSSASVCVRLTLQIEYCARHYSEFMRSWRLEVSRVPTTS